MQRRIASNEEGIVFENRIIELLKALNYRIVEEPTFARDRGFDFIIQHEHDIFHTDIAVELKSFQTPIAAANVIQVIERLEQTHIDKGMIITTLGFTNSAKKIAAQKDKVVLFTEMELIEKLKPSKQKIFYRKMLDAEYFQQILSNYYLKLNPFQAQNEIRNFIYELPSDRLNNLIEKAIPSKKLVETLIAEIPPAKILGLIIEVIGPEEAEIILKQITGKTPLVSREQEDLKKELLEDFQRAKKEKDSNRKGKLLEQIMCRAFQLVSNLQVVGNDIDNEREEIDIQLRNNNNESIWNVLGPMIFVECKNWSDPVGPDEITVFKGKLERHGLNAGIFVAVNGISGKRFEGAQGIIEAYKKDGYRILVLEGRDLEEIFACADLSDVLDQKFVELYQVRGVKKKKK